MASVESNQNGDCVDDMSVDVLLPLADSDACDDFGEPEILPRIGDEHQVQIPPLLGEINCISYPRNLSYAQNEAHFDHKFFIGLPIPLIWVSKEGERMKQEKLELPSEPKTIPDSGPSESKTIETAENFSHDENVGINIGPSHNTIDNGGPAVEAKELQSDEKLSNCSGQGFLLLPGLVSDCLSDIEKEPFLLGLYIFGKNFTQLRRFIESKGMGTVLSFYYGKFYRSREYRRWSECRKMRSRRCVHGQKIFSGLRQQELLSRILPSVSDECQNALLEVCKTFGEGKMSLEDYVFSLKTMVGTNILVKAVGIGKGKQDLTGMAFETSRSNQVIPIRPEIPTGKACSALTPSEIVKFLTGDYRLSKAWSNDLFWEAVWPRLLARGWHSEEPKNQGYAAVSMYSLVFLMPGIKKFSRRKLVKGEHYYDCVADVLSKVAREPGLLEFETEEDEGNKNKEEYKWTSERKLVQDDHDLPTRQRHFYLQPRTPNRNTDAMTFTVVDTSSADGKPYKLRELKSLPFEISNMLTSQNRSEDRGEDTHGEATDESDIVDTMLADDSETNNINFGTTKSNVEILPGRRDCDTICQGNDISVSNLKNKKDLRKDKKSRNLVKSQVSRKLKRENVDNIAPTTKRRRRLTACSRNEISNGVTHSAVVPSLENEMTSFCSDIHEFTENTPTQAGSSQEKLSFTGSSKGSPTGSVECTEPHLRNLQTHSLIDLNLPQVSPDFENGVLTTEIIKEEEDQTLKPDDHCPPKSSAVEANSDEQPSMNLRRHSTRNRPLTAKALEALANGFLTTNRRRKNKDAASRENLTSRAPRYARDMDMVALNEFSNDTLTSQIQEGENGVSNTGDSNMCNKFQVLTDENGNPVSGL
ncbi:uncharacterized protein Fot_52095 [Forsythia ovata]|uniref:Uncharacterized protein n=1 Tax=Forsythia ovata TaxID=205694 RepID=A0ABD1PMC3_9LAMI